MFLWVTITLHFFYESDACSLYRKILSREQQMNEYVSVWVSKWVKGYILKQSCFYLKKILVNLHNVCSLKTKENKSYPFKCSNYPKSLIWVKGKCVNYSPPHYHMDCKSSILKDPLLKWKFALEIMSEKSALLQKGAWVKSLI